ncbi:hypothetical protein DDE18_20365 [Nocardioides gansuensis]|uniref:Pentapeptide repeat-containing protein n=1 Tax=Nocardioides gansuensis TaxID=2138300 RepID=A0A2T8F5F5_9ACTN|nr:hypothetical protein DDE18_20365 [Nocardioides gansuensis]
MMGRVHLPVVQADCSRCFGLCCVLLPFRAASGFGADKEGGVACRHLQADDRCEIHATLRDDGWPGCTVFDCFGAGQQVSQVTYAGVSWREQANLPEMTAVFSVMRQLHEMVAHLSEADARAPGSGTERLLARFADLVAATPDELLALDVEALRQTVGEVLAETSSRLRRPLGPGPDLAGRDLAGRDLHRRDLRGATLRGALLVGADLRTDLTLTDLLGADLRDADVRGADLLEALFLSQAQVNAMRGDAATRLPPQRDRPAHWVREQRRRARAGPRCPWRSGCC